MIYKSLSLAFKVFSLSIFSLNIYPFNKKFYKIKIRLLNSFHLDPMELASNFILKKARLNLPPEIIAVNQDIICVEELMTRLACGDYEELGLTRDEATEFLANWLISFDKKSGLGPTFLTNLFFKYQINLIEQIVDNFSESQISSLYHWKLLSFTNFLYSKKTQKEIFEPIVCDWQDEYFEALFKKEIWKARWINVRYTKLFY